MQAQGSWTPTISPSSSATLTPSTRWRTELKSWEDDVKPLLQDLDILSKVKPGDKLEFYQDGSVQISVTSGYGKSFQSLSRNFNNLAYGARISGSDTAHFVSNTLSKITAAIEGLATKNFLDKENHKPRWGSQGWKRNTTNWIALSTALGEFSCQLAAARVGINNLKNSHSDNEGAGKSLKNSLEVLDKKIQFVAEYIKQAERKSTISSCETINLTRQDCFEATPVNKNL